MTTAISIENVSKQYRLGQVGTGTISHDLNRWWARLRGQEDPYSTVGQVNRRDQAAKGEYVWALKDVNLQVEQGEVLGIIGANGAGKSTLLKLISRITSPTTGEIKAKGRIASLLEVGTGMHPEMTARENIYLNGSILGMRRHEITRKFDDIIDFAGCRMYVDTPIKRFSSGMTVRLAFAVAAFLEPEILIVDEVLAVGDAEFQKKAIGKMEEVSRGGGRTILFVSHNLAAVESFCNGSVLLNSGNIAKVGKTTDVLSHYARCVNGSNTNGDVRHIKDRTGDGRIRLTSFQLEDESGILIKTLRSGIYVVVALGFETLRGCSFNNVDVGISLHTHFDSRLAAVYSSHTGHEFGDVSGSGHFRCHLRRLPLASGVYNIRAVVKIAGEVVDWVRSSVGVLHVESGDFYGSGRATDGSIAPFLIDVQWSMDADDLCRWDAPREKLG